MNDMNQNHYHKRMHAMDDGNNDNNNRHRMHMTFFWSQNAEILFSGWPGSDNRTGMYILSLLFVFSLAFIVEFLSHSSLIKRDTGNLTAGLVQTFMHGLRMALAYLVMLAIMSFNLGVFLAALFGHVLGFLFFGSRVFKRSRNPLPYGKPNDLPPMSC